MSTATSRGNHTVVVFSHDAGVRERIRTAVGRRPAPDLGRIDYIECATGSEVVDEVDAGGIDLLILDGEAQPTGGMGICRQVKNEITDCPPVCIVIGRRDDRWLATWSQADATITHPVDPVTAASTVAGLLRDPAGNIATG
jgi:DNA-binding response OmpR family regulator